MRINKNSGFTLIELVIVIAIIGILATAVLTGTDFLDQRKQAQDVGNYNIARNLQAALEQYQLQTNTSIVSGTDIASLKDNLINNNIIKSSFLIPSGFTTIVNASGNVSVTFSLASTKFNKLNCTPSCITVSKGNWVVPDCGQLK